MLEYEARQLERTARALGVAIGPGGWVEGGRPAGDLPPEPVHASAARLRAAGEPARLRLFPRPPGDAGHARVRRLLRNPAPKARGDRSCAGDLERDGGADPRDRNRVREAAPDPDRDRHRSVPPAHRATSGRCPPRARASRVRVRRRLVPEGRRRLGRRAGTEAHQGPGRAACGRRAAVRTGARDDVPAHRPLAGLRAQRAWSGSGFRTATFSFPPSTPSRRRTRPSTSASSPRATRAGRARFSKPWRPRSRS